MRVTFAPVRCRRMMFPRNIWIKSSCAVFSHARTIGFAMNARSTPCRILRYHAIDQVPDPFRDPFSANLLSHLRDQAPVHTESGTVPARYGLRSNKTERGLPCGPNAASEHPEEFVEKAEPGFGALALKHNQLLPERQIFRRVEETVQTVD